MKKIVSIICSIVTLIAIMALLIACTPQSITGKYVCENDSNSYIDVQSVNTSNNTGKITVTNFSAPSYSVYKATQSDITVELTNRSGNSYTFKGTVAGKQILGTLDAKNHVIVVDGIRYIL